MRRRTVLAGVAGLATASAARAQAAPQELQFWHAMHGALLDALVQEVDGFNASQPRWRVVPVFKGGYEEVLVAAIAAARAGQPPHILQVYDVGTGTMVFAGPAVKPAWQLFQETGVAVDPAGYIPAVRGFYSLPDGHLASMPFNSSTGLMWINADAFRRAGLDPARPPATWADLRAAAEALKAKGGTEVPITLSGVGWIHTEQYGAIHDLLYASRENGFAGLDAELLLDHPARVGHLRYLMELQAAGLARYNGRSRGADTSFQAGRAAIVFGSSADRFLFQKAAQFEVAPALLPYDPAVIDQPINSMIGGASLWTLTARGRVAAEYEGVARFLGFLARPEMDARWHQQTGYLPVTQAGFDLSRQQGYYAANPGADLPIRQLERGHVSPASRGFRLGRMPEVRAIVEEEMEHALQGQKSAQAAMIDAVARGNRVLRDFQRSVRS